MIFGDPSGYAIELFHEPVDKGSFYLTGRLRLLIADHTLGNVGEASCAFSPFYYAIRGSGAWVETLQEKSFAELSPQAVFAKLDQALFHDGRTDKAVRQDAERFGRFVFMTNRGEMFDRTKSFVYMDRKQVVVVWRNYDANGDAYPETQHGRIDKRTFVDTNRAFVDWYENEESTIHSV